MPTTTTVTQKISQMLWFDNQAEEAANFYISVFPNSHIHRIVRYGKEGFEIHGQKEGTVMTMDLDLDGQRFSVLNGGPIFKLNPAISFFATFESESQVDAIWEKLSEGGIVMVPLDSTEWSNKYGWVQDRFGISWQIAFGSRNDVGGQSFVPSLMFVKEHYGQAKEAMNFYTSIFKNSKISGILHYNVNELPDREGTIKHAQFTLDGQTFMVMDSGLDHPFTFSEAISLIVNCETQQEIDYYWDNLTEGGDPASQVCGWLKDKYGVSWQIVPTIMEEMLQDPDTGKTDRVTKAFLSMKKFIISDLIKAYEGR